MDFNGVNMLLEQLKEVFPEKDLEWRVQQCGANGSRVWALVLCYVTNRAIMDRLDKVVGPENWQNRYEPGPGGGVICGLSIRIGDEWVTKWDGAENTDVEPIKGGLSASMKRAAVQWGIGRYLYQIEESFANVHDGGAYRGRTKDGTNFKWDPPALPVWALPAGASHAEAKATNKAKESKPVVLGDESKVKAALVKLTSAGTVKELADIEAHADKLLKDGVFTQAQRDTIQKGIVRAAERINAIQASPFNPENKS